MEDEYLDAILVGGLEPADVRIVPYDDAWAERFELERGRILAALGSRARRIEHIGSTAVPGLAAKPIVDVVVTVEDMANSASLAAILEAAGYMLRVREPDHLMFRTPPRDVHIHVYRDDAPEVERYLRLRTRLRSSRQDRELYETTKRDLAGRQWSDMNYYADAKSEVINGILSRALDESGN